jgi:hypothetical protein
MLVRNLHGRTGREVANQFVIDDGDNEWFQSYRTIVARKDYDNGGQVTLDTYALDYSNTTSRYLYQFLGYGADRASVKARIKSGKYLVADLNK